MSLQKISQIIAGQIAVDTKEITLKSEFKEDLGIDSLDIFEIIMELEEEYGIEISTEDIEEIKKVGDLVNYIDNRLNEETIEKGDSYE